MQGELRENLLIQRDLTRKLIEGRAMGRRTRCGFGQGASLAVPEPQELGLVRPIHVVGE